MKRLKVPVPVQGRGLIPRLFEELFTQITERQQPKVQLAEWQASSCTQPWVSTCSSCQAHQPAAGAHRVFASAQGC